MNEIKLYEEAFLIYDEDVSYTNDAGMFSSVDLELLILESFEDVQDALAQIYVDDIVFAQPAVLHGIITPATIIPSAKMVKKSDIWVFQHTGTLSSERFGRIIQGTLEQVDIEELEGYVADILAGGFDAEQTTYIFYGESVPVGHAIDEENMSDKIFAECDAIGKTAKTLEQGA